MANLHLITDQLATGGDLPWRETDMLEAVDEWLALGITHVVDNRGEWNDEALVAEVAPQIQNLWNPTDDAGNGQPDHWFGQGAPG